MIFVTQKMIVLFLLAAVLMAGCGASAPAEAAMDAENQAVVYSNEPAEEDLAGARDGHENHPPEEGPDQVGDPGAAPPEKSAHQIMEFTCFSLRSQEQRILNENGLELVYTKQSIAESRFPDANGIVSDVLREISLDFEANSQYLEEAARTYVAECNPQGFYAYSNYQTMDVPRHDSSIVSLVCTSSVYSGGAHPSTVQMAYNLDLRQGVQLILEDVIYEESVQQLYQMVMEKVEQRFSPYGEVYGLYEDYAQVLVQTLLSYGDMTAYWYLSDTGLVLYYNQYELAPYAAGIIQVELPYGELEGILKEEYHPEQTDMPGDLLAYTGAWSGYRHICNLTAPDAGISGQMQICASGEVGQLQIFRVEWLNGTPIGQELLYSADCLPRNCLLEIRGIDFSDPDSVTVVRFLDGTGVEKAYRLSYEGLVAYPE